MRSNAWGRMTHWVSAGMPRDFTLPTRCELHPVVRTHSASACNGCGAAPTVDREIRARHELQMLTVRSVAFRAWWNAKKQESGAVVRLVRAMAAAGNLREKALVLAREGAPV